MVHPRQRGEAVKVIEITNDHPDLLELLRYARQEPVLLLTADGGEFLLSEADDFEAEVASLRASPAFQQFLDERSRRQRRFSIDEIEGEIDQELAL
jgi:hypothetical protein